MAEVRKVLWVQTKPGQSISDLVNAVRKVEAFQECQGKTRQETSGSHATVAQVTSAVPPPKEMTDRLANLERRARDQDGDPRNDERRPGAGRVPRNFVGKCYGCGEEGHISTNCPHRKVVVCYSCNGEGHIAPNCPLKAAQMAGRRGNNNRDDVRGRDRKRFKRGKTPNSGDHERPRGDIRGPDPRTQDVRVREERPTSNQSGNV